MKGKEADNTKSRILSNNWYIIKMIIKGAPAFMPLLVLNNVLRTIRDVLISIVLLRFIINSLQQKQAFIDILPVIIAVAALSVVAEIYNAIYLGCIDKIGYKRVYGYIQKELFKQSVRVDISCFEKPEFYDSYVKALQESSTCIERVIRAIGWMIACVCSLALTSFYILTIDYGLIVFALLPLAVNLSLGKWYNKTEVGFQIDIRLVKRKKEYVKRVFYLADYAKEMRTTNIFKVMFSRFEKVIDELIDVCKKYGRSFITIYSIQSVITRVIVYFGTSIFCCVKVMITHAMMFGDAAVIIRSIGDISDNIAELSNIMISFDKNSRFIENLRAFMECEPAIVSPSNPLPIKNGSHTLEIKNLTFHYDGSNRAVLDNVSFSLNPGEKIAIVGYNGAGKTTLIKLIMRFYDPTSGQILLDGKDIREYDLKQYRNLFGTVFQDFKTFSVSVTENIMMKPDITQEDTQTAITALESSDGMEMVRALPKGLDTVLTKEFDKNGKVLSGGQAQKIAIARAFAKSSPVVILDEPSSALDPIGEYKMYESMLKLGVDRSVVFISHRLSSAVLADKVYMMESGKIAEEGSHNELLRLNGKYAEMFYKQAEKYGVEQEELA